MQLPDNISDVKEFFQKEEFILATYRQIIKDLMGLSPDELNIELNIDDDNLLDNMTHHLSLILLKMDSRNLQQFIYSVDIKESQYIDAVSKEDDFQQLAFLIIKREAQKVYLRSKFG